MKQNMITLHYLMNLFEAQNLQDGICWCTNLFLQWSNISKEKQNSCLQAWEKQQIHDANRHIKESENKLFR